MHLPSDLLELHHRTVGDAVVLAVTGEIDLLTAPLLSTGLDLAFAEAKAPGPVVLDLSGVTFMASTGLTLLLKTRTRGEEAGTPLRLVVTGRAVERAIRLSGLEALLPMSSSVAEAIGSADAVL